MFNTAEMIDTPWLIADDFNAMMTSGDKIGGARFNFSKPEESRSSVHISGLIEMIHNGGDKSWCNGPVGSNRIFGKLDCVFVNSFWNNFFPNAQLEYLTRLCCDHCPIIVKKLLWRKLVLLNLSFRLCSCFYC